MKLAYNLLVFSLISIIAIGQSALGQVRPCQELRNELQQKNVRLSEYLGALKKLDRLAQPILVELLTDKCIQLRQEISNSERELAICENPRLSGEGPGPIKSVEGEEATKSCGELRKRLLVLSKTVHNFRRRQSSLLSELTIAEKKEFREASQELDRVREALSSRCSASAAPKPFRRGSNLPR